MVKKLSNPHAVVLALFIALTFIFFIGSFANAPFNMNDSFKGNYWFYINRGYPEAWSGVALKDSQVDFPLVSLLFLSIQNNQKEFIKIIDLKLFSPLFIGAFLPTYFPAFIFAKAVEENKKLFGFLIGFYFLVITSFIFIYFFVFSIL